jgi:hypothetical protein
MAAAAAALSTWATYSKAGSNGSDIAAAAGIWRTLAAHFVHVPKKYYYKTKKKSWESIILKGIEAVVFTWKHF